MSPPTDIFVRPLRPGDRSELLRMRRSLWPDSDEAEMETLVPGAPEPHAWVLVAVRPGGRLGGFAEVAERPFAEGCRSSPVAYLEGIWVDSDLRRTGVATQLVRAVEASARSRGLTELASDTGVENRASRRFHESAGFDEVARVVCFHRPIPPADSSSSPG